MNSTLSILQRHLDWHMFQRLKKRGFEILALHHAEAILKLDMPEAASDLEEALLQIRLPVSELVGSGGGEAKSTQRLRNALASLGWGKPCFQITKSVDGVQKEATTHEVDHVKRFNGGTIALEIEWNNKDPFFDRDLENFKRLHADAAISVGAIITRGSSLQANLVSLVEGFAKSHGIASIDNIRSRNLYTPTPRQARLYEKTALAHGDFAAGWSWAFVADKFGEATTHWRKLKDRVDRGVGNPCPLLLIGISSTVVTQDEIFPS